MLFRHCLRLPHLLQLLQLLLLLLLLLLLVALLPCSGGPPRWRESGARRGEARGRRNALAAAPTWPRGSGAFSASKPAPGRVPCARSLLFLPHPSSGSGTRGASVLLSSELSWWRYGWRACWRRNGELSTLSRTLCSLDGNPPYGISLLASALGAITAGNQEVPCHQQRRNGTLRLAKMSRSRKIWDVSEQGRVLPSRLTGAELAAAQRFV